MNMLKIFNLKAKKHQGTTEVDNQVKQVLKARTKLLKLTNSNKIKNYQLIVIKTTSVWD